MPVYPNGEVPIWRVSVFWLAAILPRTTQFHFAGRHWGIDPEQFFNFALVWLQQWWAFALSEECEVLNLTVTNIIELTQYGADLNGLNGAVPGPVHDLDRCVVVSFLPEYADRRNVVRWYLPGISANHVSGSSLTTAGRNHFATWAGLFVNAGCTQEQEAGWQAVNVRPVGTLEDNPLNPGWDAYPVWAVRVSRYLANTPRVAL